MNPVEMFKIFRLYQKAQTILKGNSPLTSKITQTVHLLTTLFGIVGVPTLFDTWIHTPAHAAIYAGLLSFSVLLHALSPSLFGGPSTAVSKQMSLFMLLFFVPAFIATPQVHAQTATDSTSIYAGGISWNQNATPQIAGTGLYVHDITAGQKAFAIYDALPTSTKPFTVTSNIGGGIAQKVFTVGNATIYSPIAAGFSFSGTNAGWEWNGGLITSIPYKKFLIMPNVRFLKSSVSNGSGYQPIVGVLFGLPR